MIQDQALVASKNILIETENRFELDSIAVSVFADIFIELTNILKHYIRRQDPNNYSFFSFLFWKITILILRRGALSSLKLFICFADKILLSILCSNIISFWPNEESGKLEKTMRDQRKRKTERTTSSKSFSLLSLLFSMRALNFGLLVACLGWAGINVNMLTNSKIII